MFFSRLASITSSRNTLLRNFIGPVMGVHKCNMSSDAGIHMGIDLGTTNSCVAIMEGFEPRIIVNAEGHRTTPSVVAFLEDGSKLVGEAAKRQAISNSKNTIYGTKRLIGRRYRDKEVQEEMKHLPFELCEHTNGDCWVKVKGTPYSPSTIGSFVLAKMKETVDNYVGLKIKNAVITVPAYFNDSQRQATKDAGSIAGLNVVRIINEPTAAALAYGLNRKDRRGTIAVYDLGGGTFDISILEINEGVFEVKSTNGDTKLGGEDFDNVIIKYLIETINLKLKTDVKQDLKALQRIKEAAEKAKIELSFVHETEINLPYLIGANSYSEKFSRSKLESLVSNLIERTLPPCTNAMKDAGVSLSDLSDVILVGGMTRMPKVQQAVKDFFKREPSKGVNPDEAVAMGAAIQGGVLVGHVTDIVLVDITPYSLGVKTLNDIFAPIVIKNTAIPTRKSEVFTTSEDNQTYVDIGVFQGERSMCHLNLHLGDFRLGPIPARPRGASKIEVIFEVDSNGIVNVTALDTETQIKANATIKSNPRGLSKEELEKLAKEAEKERANDAKLKAAATAKIACESQLHDLTNFLDKNREHINAADVEKCNTSITTFNTDINVSPNRDEQYYRNLSGRISEEISRIRSLMSQPTPTPSADTSAPQDSNVEPKA
ncbi:Stress-70 protein, mitochondrial [Thelohanellus kitauei]|uniref:Stress-70 protein, mitochondrial n=1 Tax=Thelohanellus kitauei TaxID=669202 RepID=A0A0C2MNH0_THEKT|nr:Stress-70 protein, mitochondrial [Thelohanellus kitauei]